MPKVVEKLMPPKYNFRRVPPSAFLTQTWDDFILFLLERRVEEMCKIAISKVAAWWSGACLVTGDGKNGAEMPKNLH